MNAQDAVNKLCVHLLGKDWYIVDPVGVEQGNDIIVDQIMKRYPAVDETPVDKWRRKHKRCKWCRNCESFGPYLLYHKCVAKDHTNINIDIPRLFCTLFELKKEKTNANS